jgi:hypothetical protein
MAKLGKHALEEERNHALVLDQQHAQPGSARGWMLARGHRSFLPGRKWDFDGANQAAGSEVELGFALHL